MTQRVKERSDIEVQHPVPAPAAFPRLPKCLMRRLSRPIPVGVRMKVFLQLRLQHLFHHRLGNPVCDRRNPQRANSAARLGNLDSPNR